MNAMNYVNNPDAAQHWRIRAGTANRDTSHAISAMLAVKLQMSGKRVGLLNAVECTAFGRL